MKNLFLKVHKWKIKIQSHRLGEMIPLQIYSKIPVSEFRKNCYNSIERRQTVQLCKRVKGRLDRNLTKEDIHMSHEDIQPPTNENHNVMKYHYVPSRMANIGD